MRLEKMFAEECFGCSPVKPDLSFYKIKEDRFKLQFCLLGL